MTDNTKSKKPHKQTEATTAVAGYRLNWNPQRAPHDITPEDIEELEREGSVDLGWRCGNAKIVKGHRIYLVRTGKGPRGIIGRGVALSEPFEDDSRGVFIRFQLLSFQPFIARSLLDNAPLNQVPWSAQTAAVKLTTEHVSALDALINVDQPPSREPVSRIVDIESTHTEAGIVSEREQTLLQRAESILLRDYAQYRKTQGVTLRSLVLRPPHWPFQLRCDAYDESARLIIEAKADNYRESIRMAIGQLADYARLLPADSSKAVLLPAKPHSDLLALLKSQQIRAIWKNGATFEDSGPN